MVVTSVSEKSSVNQLELGVGVSLSDVLHVGEKLLAFLSLLFIIHTRIVNTLCIS